MIVKSKSPSIIILLLYIFITCFTLYPTYNSISLYVIIPLLFVVYLFKNMSVLLNKYIVLYLVLFLLMIISMNVSKDMEIAMNEIKAVLGVFLLSVLTFILVKSNERYIPYFHLFIILHLLALLQYMHVNNEVIIAESNETRANSSELNANTLAYFLFYSTFSAYILYYQAIKYKKIFFVLFVLMCLATFYIALITASRQVLIIQVPLIIALLVVPNFKFSLSLIFKLLFVLLICTGVGYFFYINYFQNSFLAERYLSDVSDGIRFKILMRAIEVGFDNFIWGVGPGQFLLYNPSGHFSHCTYTELFANFGFLGPLLFMSIIIRFILKNLKWYRMTKDKVFLIFLIFMMFFAADNFFYVFYADMWLMMYLFLILAHNESYINKLRKINYARNISR